MHVLGTVLQARHPWLSMCISKASLGGAPEARRHDTTRHDTALSALCPCVITVTMMIILSHTARTAPRCAPLSGHPLA